MEKELIHKMTMGGHYAICENAEKLGKAGVPYDVFIDKLDEMAEELAGDDEPLVSREVVEKSVAQLTK